MEYLFVNWNADPVLLKLGPLSIRWYGLLFISGFIFGYWLFIKIFKREGLPTKPLLDPMLYMLLLCAFVGARLGHVFFYEPEYYLSHPIEILKVWKGGLASHGGAIAIVFGIWWYVHKYGKKNKFDFLWLADRLAVAIPFAGMAIRLGNLMNSEIYGHPTTLPWGFVFLRNNETVACHPTQIYEAGSYLLIGLILMALYFALTKKALAIQGKYAAELAHINAKDPHAHSVIKSAEHDELEKIHIYGGFLFGLFLVLLFATRFFIEYVKNPQVDAEIGRTLNNGQLLSIPFIVAGIAIIIWSFYAKKPIIREL